MEDSYTIINLISIFLVVVSGCAFVIGTIRYRRLWKKDGRIGEIKIERKISTPWTIGSISFLVFVLISVISLLGKENNQTLSIPFELSEALNTIDEKIIQLQSQLTTVKMEIEDIKPSSESEAFQSKAINNFSYVVYGTLIFSLLFGLGLIFFLKYKVIGTFLSIGSIACITISSLVTVKNLTMLKISQEPSTTKQERLVQPLVIFQDRPVELELVATFKGFWSGSTTLTVDKTKLKEMDLKVKKIAGLIATHEKGKWISFILIVGSVDQQELTKVAQKILGTNTNLAKLRANDIKLPIEKMLIGHGMPYHPPVFTIPTGPNGFISNASLEDLAQQRRVDVYLGWNRGGAYKRQKSIQKDKIMGSE